LFEPLFDAEETKRMAFFKEILEEKNRNLMNPHAI